jgi:hypothetical protein
VLRRCNYRVEWPSVFGCPLNPTNAWKRTETAPRWVSSPCARAHVTTHAQRRHTKTCIHMHTRSRGMQNCIHARTHARTHARAGAHAQRDRTGVLVEAAIYRALSAACAATFTAGEYESGG